MSTRTRRHYADYLQRARRTHGDKFSESGLAKQFLPYFESQQRVRIRFAYGEELTGTIGVTTGWQPCFLLMRRSNSIGSPWTLGADDKIVAVQHGRTYVPVDHLYVA